MWIRFLDYQNKREVIFNSDFIWKIEVQYAFVAEQLGTISPPLPLRMIPDDPGAVRFYYVFVQNEKFTLDPRDDGPAAEAIRRIYNEAIKG